MGGCSNDFEVKFTVQRNHRRVAFSRVGHQARKAVEPGIRDLPAFKQLTEAAPLKGGKDAGAGNIERTGAMGVGAVFTNIVSEVDIFLKGAAADFSAIDQQPVRVIAFPIGRAKVVRCEDFTIEGGEASKFIGQDGFSELGSHSWSSSA